MIAGTEEPVRSTQCRNSVGFIHLQLAIDPGDVGVDYLQKR